MTSCEQCGSKDLVGVEYVYPHPDSYDGVSEWLCLEPSCGARWGRWSGKRLAEGESEGRYGRPSRA